MIKNAFHFLLLLFFFNVAQICFSQSILSESDSIPIEKPKQVKQNYIINRYSIHEISIILRDPKSVTERPKKFWENFTEGILTMSTGIITTSENESLYMTLNEINTNDFNTSWRIPLYFTGNFQKTRERVRNDDGSYSIDSKKGITIAWEKGAYGYIMEKSDSLGRFVLQTNFLSDSEGLTWLNKIEKESKWIKDKFRNYGPQLSTYNYSVSGLIRNKKFYMVNSGSNFRSVILIENEPVAIFQSDPNTMIIGKKNRIEPYILVKSKLEDTEIADILRLALLNRMLILYLSRDFYE